MKLGRRHFNDSKSSCRAHWPHLLLYLLMKRRGRLYRAEMGRLERKYLYHSLSMAERRKRRSCISRKGLMEPNESPFQKVYECGHDQNMICLTGLDYRSFHKLLQQFTPYYNGTSIRRKYGKITKRKNKSGRPRKLSAAQTLGLYLAWTRTRGSSSVLQLIFGINASTLSLFLRYARRILEHVLLQDKDSVICLPDARTIKRFQKVIKRRYPYIKGTVFCMDGLKLEIEKSPDQDEQEIFFNGWHHTHWVNNVLVFSPDGKIVIAGYNFPGSNHDSTVALGSKIYDKLEACHADTGARCVVDSAFPVSGRMRNVLIRSGKEDVRCENSRGPLINKQATQYRQASEWSMRSLQGSMPRMKDVMKWETKGERKLILKVFFLLHNFRCANLGQNQMQTVFMNNIGRNAEEMVDMSRRGRALYLQRETRRRERRMRRKRRAT